MPMSSTSPTLDRYDASAGLIPQIIVLTIFDAIFLALNELLVLMGTVASRLQGAHFKYAQSSVNACFEPPSFELSNRYAYMLKIAASVLVFAPAAPLLYLLGGLALLFGFFCEKLALVKMYRRPPSTSEHAAERCRIFLLGLTFMHVCSSCVFFSQQAYVTGSRWDFVEMRPFALAFVLVVGWYLVEATLLRWLLVRNASAEDSGAGNVLYQELDSSWIASRGSAMPDYFFRAAKAEEHAAHATMRSQLAMQRHTRGGGTALGSAAAGSKVTGASTGEAMRRTPPSPMPASDSVTRDPATVLL